MTAGPSSFFQWPARLVVCLALAACSSQPPVPEWQMNAHGAVQKGIEAYLSGHSRVAALEFARARQETARTGEPTLLARVVLLECAARVASLELTACDAFDGLREDAGSAERAYAAYLAGRALAQDIPRLPVTQQTVAVAPSDAAASVLAGMTDPLSRLVAAGVLLRTGRADARVVQLAVDTASQQGWRRPLLAWLLVQAQRADAAGLADEAARLRRRIMVVEQGGALP